MSNFAITGVGGYIAPRHLKAIKDTGNILVAAVDPNDSVGILDQYFPDASFFTEFERFDRHLEKLKRKGSNSKVEYLTICSPNHLHDAHIRLALRVGANAICEKPLVLNEWNLDALSNLEEEYGKKIYTILQLRVHPSLIKLREKIRREKTINTFDVCLTYITARGPWYYHSWKGDLEKSGGLATNIGIHFFDLLIWLFGDVRESHLNLNELSRMSGFIKLEKANVVWFLSIDKNDLPYNRIQTNSRTFRSIIINNEEIEFSDGFTDLHTVLYENILRGTGFGIEDSRKSIEFVSSLRRQKISNNYDLVHPFFENQLINADMLTSKKSLLTP